MMELKDKKVLVVGLGKSGLAAALFLRKRGALVTVSVSGPSSPEPAPAATMTSVPSSATARPGVAARTPPRTTAATRASAAA